jgi:hypothetical protein
METEISAAFSLTGFESTPDEITNILEIQPTKAWKVGDAIGKSSLTRKQNGWVLSSSLDKFSSDLEDHVKNVLEQLHPKWAVLVSLCSQYDAEVSCVIHSYSAQGPAIHFSKEILKQIAQLSAEIDVDYYSLANDSDDAT